MNLLPTISSFLLLVGTTALFGGNTSAQGPVGKWNLKMFFGEREIESQLTIAKGKGGKLEGSWQSRRGESAISNVKFDKGTLTFARTVTFGEEDAEVTFEGQISGDKLAGQFSSEFGELDVTGARQAASAKKEPSKSAKKRPASPLIGTWELTTRSQRGERKSKLIINADMSGASESERGKRSIRNVKLVGQKVSYQMVVARQEQEFVIDFSGTLTGTKMTGKYSFENRGEIADVTAVKVQPKPAKKAVPPTTVLVGTWDVVSESDRGENKAELIINRDLSGQYVSSRGTMDVSGLKLDGDALEFTITIEFGENEFALDFAGKHVDGMFNGSFALEGQGEVADVVGKKREASKKAEKKGAAAKGAKKARKPVKIK